MDLTRPPWTSHADRNLGAATGLRRRRWGQTARLCLVLSVTCTQQISALLVTPQLPAVSRRAGVRAVGRRTCRAGMQMIPGDSIPVPMLAISMLIPALESAPMLLVSNPSLLLSNPLLLASAVSLQDAARYFFAGGICCCISHGVTVPIDVVKTRMQTDPNIRDLSVTAAGKAILEREGAAGLFAGFGSTIVGFTTSGAVKYGLYEVFKPFALDFVAGSSVLPNSPILGFLIAGAQAEIVASTLLCPLEATRIRLVTDPEYGKEVFDALPRMCREEGWDIYNSLPIIMLKMVPGTMSQLASYEFFTRSAYSAVQTLGISADTSQRFVISTLCAVFAGVVSTLTSQPGDTILSEVNKGSGGKKVERELREVVAPYAAAPQELFRGVKARLIHLLALITTQLVIYDYAKQLVGLAATGVAK